MEAEKRAVGALLLLWRLRPESGGPGGGRTAPGPLPPPDPGPPRPRGSGAPPARRPVGAHTRASPGASAPRPPTACPHRLAKDPGHLGEAGV